MAYTHEDQIAAYRITCPTCGAKPHQRCGRTTKNKVPHQARIKKATEGRGNASS